MSPQTAFDLGKRRLGVSRERMRQMLEQEMLAGFRIEGHPRGRYIDLNGEWAENDRLLVTIQEAAVAFEVSSATIRRWLESGRVESFAWRATGAYMCRWTDAPPLELRLPEADRVNRPDDRGEGLAPRGKTWAGFGSQSP